MKGRRLFWIVLIAAVCAAAAAGSAYGSPPKPGEGGILKVAAGAYPPTLDWPTSTSTATREIGMNIFESLVSYNKKFEIIPMLATRWEKSADGLAYTFHLRKGVKFHNGREMNSEDVVHSVKRFQKVGSRKADFDVVKDIVALDPHTVRFDLNQKSGTLLAALGSPVAQVSIMPKEVVLQNGEYVPGGKLPVDPEHIVGTGPYKFNKWLRDRYLSIVCFKDYKPHEDAPGGGLGGHRLGYFEEIRFHKVDEPSARVAGVETGQFHIGDQVPYELVMKVKEKPGLVIATIKPYTWPYMKFNYHPDPDGKPSLMSNLKVRQAVLALLNMEELMKAAGSGPGRLDPGLMFKEHVFWSDAGRELYNQANPEKAKALLKEAGYDGREIRLLTTEQYAYMYKTAVNLQNQLSTIGVPAKIILSDWPSMYERWKKGGYWDISFSGISTRFDPSNHNILWYTKSSAEGYSDPEVDRLVEQGMIEDEFDKRYETYKKLQQLTYEKVIVIKEFDDNMYQIHTDKLKGYEPWYLIRMWNTWLEE